MTSFGRRSRIASFAAGALLLLSACGGGPAPTDTAAPASGAAATAEPTGDAPAATDSLLTGQFTTVSGETIDLSTYQGQDVVLWYWAPW